MKIFLDGVIFANP